MMRLSTRIWNSPSSRWIAWKKSVMGSLQSHRILFAMARISTCIGNHHKTACVHQEMNPTSQYIMRVSRHDSICFAVSGSELRVTTSVGLRLTFGACTLFRMFLSSVLCPLMCVVFFYPKNFFSRDSELFHGIACFHWKSTFLCFFSHTFCIPWYMGKPRRASSDKTCSEEQVIRQYHIIFALLQCATVKSMGSGSISFCCSM